MEFDKYIDLMVKLIQFGATLVFSAVTAFVSALIYQHQRQQREEQWLSSFKILHDKFWDDADMKEVRKWIAHQASYEEVREVFKKRNLIEHLKYEYGLHVSNEERNPNHCLLANIGDEKLNKLLDKVKKNPEKAPEIIRLFEKYHLANDDYRVLEVTDKFCNLMLQVIVINPEFPHHGETWERLFIGYWVRGIINNRPEMGEYVLTHYDEFKKFTDKKLIEGAKRTTDVSRGKTVEQYRERAKAREKKSKIIRNSLIAFTLLIILACALGIFNIFRLLNSNNYATIREQSNLRPNQTPQSAPQGQDKPTGAIDLPAATNDVMVPK